MSQRINIEGIFEPKGGHQGYFRADRWMEGNFVPNEIIEGHFWPFSVNFIKNLHIYGDCVTTQPTGACGHLL